MGSGEARECTPGLYFSRQTQLCKFDSLGAGGLLTGLLWAEIAGSLYMVTLQPRDIWHNSKFSETSRGLAMHAV